MIKYSERRFRIEKVLFGAVRLTKNASYDGHKYSSLGIGFDAGGFWLLLDGSGFGKNVIIFGADISSSAHIDNKKKGILVFRKN